MANDRWANPQKMWDERFAQFNPVYGEGPNSFVEEQAKRWKPGACVLVPGDGYGRNGVWLARQGFRVHTVDLSPVGVARARKSAQAAGVQMTIEHGDLGTWNWPIGEFDGLASIFLHLPPELRLRVHNSMLRAMKPGGILILEAFSPAQLQYTSGGPKQLELLYTAEILSSDFAGAEAIQLEEKVVHLNEGAMHSGPGAVVRAVLRKP